MNQRLLVIKPPYSTFPVGFAYVLSCLERENVPFDFIDAEFGNGYRKLLKKNNYSAVATGGLIGHFNFFQNIVSDVRKINPKLPVIIGGNITKDIRPDFLLDKIGADFGVVGEAETSLPFLLKALFKESREFNMLPGLIFKDSRDGQIKKNPEQRFELEENIFPSWHHIDIEYYLKVCSLPYWGLRRAMPILSGRGCVGKCSFCSPSIGSFRPRPIEHVIEEMEMLNSKYEFEWFFFINEMLYSSNQEIETFCQAYKQIKPKKNWVCSLRVDAGTDVDTFRLLKSAGCVGISAGIESGNDKVLRLMCKKTTGEQIKSFFRDAKIAGLSCNGTFLVGNEGETEAELKETIDLAVSEAITCQESLTNAYPGTLIYKNALKRGLIHDEWEYLQNLKFGCDLWDYRWANRRHINISGISDGKFWEVIVKELRKFNTFLLNRFSARDIEYQFPFGLLTKVTGSCPDCGGKATVTSYRSLLGLKGFCRDCFQIVIFNLYCLDAFSKHFDYLRCALSEAKDLLVLGAMKEAVSLMRYDYFGSDLSKIKGFIDLDEKNADFSDFIYKPRLRLIDLKEKTADTILITDDYFQDAELRIRKFYLKEGLVLPRLVHLWPDSMRSDIGVIRFIKNFKASGNIGRMFLFIILDVALFYGAFRRALLSILMAVYPKLIKLKQLNMVRASLRSWRG